MNGTGTPRLPRLSRGEAVLAIAMLATLPLVNPYLRGEGNGTYAYVRSLVLDGDLRFDNEYRRGDPSFVSQSFRKADAQPWPPMEMPGGYLRNQWSVGPSLLWLPSFLQAVAWLSPLWHGVVLTRALVLGVPAAYAFSRLRFRAKDHWASTILSFRFMPPVAVAIPIYLMIRSLGLVDSYLGLILPYVAFSLPLVVWIMIGFFDEIPREIDDAALVDGCSRATALFRVLLPLARPGMLVAATFGVIFIWNEFLVGLFVINSTGRETIPIAASALLTVESPIDWNNAAAVGILTVLPVLAFSLLVQRYIVRGITAGAVR